MPFAVGVQFRRCEWRPWLDGVEATELSVALWPAGTVSRLQIGVTYVAVDEAVPALDCWFDDLVVATSRVGCDR